MFTGLTGIPLGELRNRCESNIKMDSIISGVAWTEFIWLRIGSSCGLL